LTVSSVTSLLAAGCELIPRAGDTEGVQRTAQWEWRGRLVVDTDPELTLVRLRVDTTGVRERHDVVMARFDFDQLAGSGDEYSLTLGLDLENARALPVNEAVPLGVAGGVAAFATVTCLCSPLRPDSVRGSLVIRQRGLRQLVMRLDAQLHFTQWADSTRQVSYPLRQPVFGVY
jgi:hypothetical protein